MDWEDLRYFLALCRCGSAAAAGRALAVEHTTVTRRVASLERDLGVSLVVRHRHATRPTPAGEDLLAAVVRIEALAHAAERSVTATASAVAGTVRLATSEGFAGFVVRQLRSLRRRHPALVVEVLAGNAPVDLARGEADLAVRLAPTRQPELVQRKLVDCAWALYAARDRPDLGDDPRDLAGQDLVAYDASLARVPGAVWLEDHADGARIAFRANSLLAALNATLAGMGIGAVPCFLGDAEPTLRRVGTELVGSRPVWLVVHPDAARVPRIRAVIDHVSDAVLAHRDLLEGRSASG